MPIDFSNDSGYVHPDALQTGDLLFPWNPEQFPVLLSKPIDRTEQVLGLGTAARLLPPNLVDLVLALFSDWIKTINSKRQDIMGHYSGHVVMIIVENNVPYVIEAGATDYTNYRITINPYHVAAEEAMGFDVNQMRGWINRRHAHQERVWHARAKPTLKPIPSKMNDVVAYAKSLLGRPYGMLDTLNFADDSRIYCSDFVYKCYLIAGLKIDDQRTWSWLLNSPTLSYPPIHLPVPLNPLVSKAIELSLSALGYAQPPALCLPALYYSSSLEHINQVMVNGVVTPYGLEKQYP